MDTLRGVFPQPKIPPKRDFLRENVMKVKNQQKMIRSISKETHLPPKANQTSKRQSYFSSQPDLSKLNNNKTHNATRSLKNVANSVKSSINGSIPSAINSFSAQSASSHTLHLVDRSSQTIDVDCEYFLKDAIIRYPSSSVLENFKALSISGENNNSEFSQTKISEQSNTEDSIRKQQIDNLVEFLETGSIKKDISRYDLEKMEKRLSDLRSARFSASSTRPQSFTSFQNPLVPPSEVSSRTESKSNQVEHQNTWNAEVPCKSATGSYASRVSVSTNKSDLPPNYKKGELPKYLVERNQQISREKEKEIDPDCPDGHILLNNNERKETLEMAEKKFNDLIMELNKMPMTLETFKIRRRKIEIERELNSLESTIRIFSKPKVYVKIDE